MSSTPTVNRFPLPWVNPKSVLVLAIATALGIVVAIYPLLIFAGFVICLTLYSIWSWTRGRINLWQTITLATLTSYLVLNYGFDNFTVLYVPAGELLMLLALALAIGKMKRGFLKKVLSDPPVTCLIALLLLSCCHLLFDVRRYGFYAVRDGSMMFEAVFLILGVAWTENPRHIDIFNVWLFVAFVANLFYSCTFFWADRIQAASPSFGVFHAVPLFGSYEQSSLWLLLGSLFCIFVAPSAVSWPRWLLVFLAIVQLTVLAVFQDRSMYVSIFLILVVLFMLGQFIHLASFASTIGWAVALLVFLLTITSVLGIHLQGRMGPVDLSFLEEHAKTILAIGDTNERMSHDVDRADWYRQTWSRVTSSTSHVIVGEGFGQALIDFENEEGIPVRQPHNSSLTVLARLGFVGLSLWLLFIALITMRFVRALRKPFIQGPASTLVIWLSFHYLVSLLQASVQPAFEFSHGAIPFFFIVGVSIGVMQGRNQGLNGTVVAG